MFIIITVKWEKKKQNNQRNCELSINIYKENKMFYFRDFKSATNACIPFIDELKKQKIKEKYNNTYN